MLGWEFPPFVSGGLGVHCFELTRALARKGIEIDFFMPGGGDGAVQKTEGLRVIPVASSELAPYMFVSKRGMRAGYGDNLLAAVEEYAKKSESAALREAWRTQKKYDVVHAHDWLTAPAGERVRKALSLPLVQTFHSTEFDRTSWPWEAILGIERRAACEANLIIAVSNRTREQVLRLGADYRKMRVVYNGVDQEKFSEGKVGAEAVNGWKRGRKVVLFLGRLTEQKGPVQFLHAAKLVLEKKPGTLFMVAGKGELLPLLISMSMSLGISKNVLFLGYVSDEDQRRIYKLADAYVMPSTSEPFGITALEAMSSGVPVILSKTSGVSEVVKAAIRVDFWDINAMAQKILAVISSPTLGKVMSRLGQRDARLCTWEKAADETLKVYKEAAGK